METIIQSRAVETQSRSNTVAVSGKTGSLSAMEQVKNLRTILMFTYGLVPIIAGFDKFTNILTNWKAYVSGFIAGLLPFSPGVFMEIVGVIEIIAGILVFVKTKYGALIVSLWLILIALNLIITGTHFDVAVRDIVMAIGAFVLFRLTTLAEKKF